MVCFFTVVCGSADFTGQAPGSWAVHFRYNITRLSNVWWHLTNAQTPTTACVFPPQSLVALLTAVARRQAARQYLYMQDYEVLKCLVTPTAACVFPLQSFVALLTAVASHKAISALALSSKFTREGATTPQVCDLSPPTSTQSTPTV